MLPHDLATIEFYAEDFTHRYTPARATATHRLRPWIFLLVLKEGEFEDLGRPGPLPAIRLVVSPADVLPVPDQAWAWAHVHASKDVTEGRSATSDEAVEALQTLLGQTLLGLTQPGRFLETLAILTGSTAS